MEINSELRPLDAQELDAISGGACKVTDKSPTNRVEIPGKGSLYIGTEVCGGFEVPYALWVPSK